jgi:hypothetical protein
MNTITLSHFFSYIADILLIVFVVGKNPGARTNHLCALLIMTFSVWSLCYGLANMAHTSDEAMYFINAGAIGWSIFPIAAIWFYLALTNRNGILHNKAAIILSIVIPVFFLYQQWTGEMIDTVARTHWGWAAIWSHTIYSYLYVAYVILSISVCAYPYSPCPIIGRTSRCFIYNTTQPCLNTC